jgi:hypothetical protein
VGLDWVERRRCQFGLAGRPRPGEGEGYTRGGEGRWPGEGGGPEGGEEGAGRPGGEGGQAPTRLDQGGLGRTLSGLARLRRPIG